MTPFNSNLGSLSRPSPFSGHSPLSGPSPFSGPSLFGRNSSPLSRISNLSIQHLSQARQELALASQSVHQLSMLGAKYIEDAANGGNICIQSLDSFFEQANTLIKSAIGDIQEVAYEAKERIQAFSHQAHKVDERLATYVLEMINKENLSNEELKRYELLKEFNNDIKEATAKTVRIYQELIAKNLELRDQRIRGLIDVAFDLRVKSIKILEAGLDVIHQAHYTEAEIFIKLHSHYLKEEAQTYDQIMQAEIVASEEIDKKHTRYYGKRELDSK
ncbi:hypothetical protein [Neochlamydia sp. S13]|uniref:hypothetical protein n=1 Tax=Neochlamydia sp. S13 TaxID=1353976 RepID=UPI0005AADD13|nr:hypothetical protein [Neochlamydia sp. S13]BBI17594.1 hypothetical protein NCS13_1_1399 [Neochlamydia sp. S13]